MSNANQNGFESESNDNRLRFPTRRQFGMLRAAILLGLLGVACSAEVIYTNFATSGDNNALSGSIPISLSTLGVSAAQSFIPSQDYVVNTLTIALSSADGKGSFTVALMTSDSTTGGPGKILEQFAVTAPAKAAPTVVPIALTSVKHPTLTANVTYWVAIAGATSSAIANWQINLAGDLASSNGDTQVDVSSTGLAGPWTGGTRNGLARGAFQVSGSPAPNSTTPTISIPLVPDTIPVGSSGFTLTVNGTHFVNGSQVNWSGLDLATIFVSDVQLTATVSTDVLSSAGTNAITVINPDGATSNIAYFTTTAVTQVTISNLSPSSIKVGGPNFNLTITGSNFTPDATVNFDGTVLTPNTVTSSTQLQVPIPAALIANPGPRAISVSEQAGTSNVLTLTVSTTSTLAISGLVPSSAVAGGDNLTLTINGFNFTSDAVVHFGTSTLAPSSVTSSQIQVTVPSTLIAVAGSPSVTVVQASGTSNAITFPITTSSTVEITSVAPAFVLAGGPNFTMLITGTNLVSDATVHFGSTVLTPFSVTDNQILVNVPSALITTVGIPSITVVESSGTSNTLTMVVGLLPGQRLTVASGGVLQPGQVGAAYSSSLVATGGAPPYSWSLVNSSLPAGLSLSPTGVIAGTPTKSGALQFSAKATDTTSATVTASFLLSIKAANSGAVITTPASLPLGTVGSPYSQQLSATGGAPPYVWSVTKGTLPAGLTLSGSGIISGTPTAAGPTSFTVQVADVVQVGASSSLTLTINDAGFGATRSGVISQVASGGGWKTSLYLVNPSTSPVTVVVNFWADTGSALSLPLAVTQVGGIQNLNVATVTETIAPNATLLIESDSHASVAATGWAEVLSIGPVTGFGVFHYVAASGAVSEATVPLESTFTPSFLLPYDGINGFTAGVALTNLFAGQAVAITATIWDENGNQIGTQAINLPAGGHISFLLADQFPAATANRGIIEFSADSTTNITGFGLRINPAGGLTLIPKLQRQ